MATFEIFPVQVNESTDPARLYEEIYRLRMQLAGAWMDIAKLKLEVAAVSRDACDWKRQAEKVQSELKKSKDPDS